MSFKKSLWLWLVTVATLGSGIITVNSVIGPTLPERRAILQEIFPLEFLHLSRFLTLLIGFALIISSINIYKRKRRAFFVVIGLAIASIIFHMTKGLDYEESIFSVILIIVLIFNRGLFTVKSSIPNLRLGIYRLILAIAIAFGYGVLGFWLLDQRHFGIDFNIKSAIRQTILILSFVGDPDLIPHTRYAKWFLDSMYMITMTALGYSLYALFRPVIYRFKESVYDRREAQEIIKVRGRSSLDFFKAWPDKSYFFSESGQSFISYRVASSFAIALGDPVGPENEIEVMIHDFAKLCQDNDWGIGFHQVLPDFLPLYQSQGFKKIKIGDDAVVDLKSFSLTGHKMKEVRHSVNMLEKMGIKEMYYEPPISSQLMTKVKEVSDEWLKISGRRERAFTLGTFDEDYIRRTPIFTAESSDGIVWAFINLIPSYAKGEATHDLMRRRVDAPNGIMDYLFVKLFMYEKQQGYDYFNLGMAPMSGFQEKEEASPEERVIHYFFQHLNFLFSYSGLKNYKAKFAQCWQPRYTIYRNALDLARFVRALGLISEISNKEMK